VKLLILTLTRDLTFSILNRLNLEAGQGHGTEPEILKGFTRHGDDGLDEIVDLLRKVPNLLLGMVIDTKLEKVKQVVEINFPIKFSECVLGQVRSSQFTGDSLLDELIVGVECQITRSLLLEEEVRAPITERLLSTLSAARSLLAELLGQEEARVDDGVTGAHLIHTGCTVTKPLTCHVDGRLDVKFEFNHLKRRRVLVTHEIADESPIIAHGLGTGSVGNTGSLYDCSVTLEDSTGHGIHEAGSHFSL